MNEGLVLIGLLDAAWPVFVLDALTCFVSLLLVLRVAVPALPPRRCPARPARSAASWWRACG